MLEQMTLCDILILVMEFLGWCRRGQQNFYSGGGCHGLELVECP